MSSSVTDPKETQSGFAADATMSPKGKGKSRVKPDDAMDEDEEDEEEDEDDEEEEEEIASDEEVDESLDEIDPSAILPIGRRTRGVKVDYTSKEALEKAGLKPDDKDEDEDEEMKD